MHGLCAPSEPSPMLFDSSGGRLCPQFNFKTVVSRWKLGDREQQRKPHSKALPEGLAYRPGFLFPNF